MTDKIQVRSWQRSAAIGLLRAMIDSYKEQQYLGGILKNILNITDAPDLFNDLIYGETGDVEETVDSFVEVV